MAVKGKEIVGETPPSKRKGDHSDKSGSRKRTNPGVLQFFDVAADVEVDNDDSEEDDSDEDDFEQDFMEEDNTGQKGKSALGKTHTLTFWPKEEELSDEELEMLVKERYKPGSKYVTHAYDQNKTAGSGEMDFPMNSEGDPLIWRVKCTVGRERRSVLCLIQKFVDLQSLGNKLKTASAFSPDHIKGYIYIEAEREFDVVEACKGLTTVYTSRISPVSKNEIAHLFSARNTGIDVPPGTWVRVKLGNYKGDLAQVVAFDDLRKKATVKIIPRIDLQALARKLAGEGTTKQGAIPVARVISSKDLEEFRPHIKLKRDRLTGKVFETICDLKLKDGYLYKKVSIESISYVDVVPSADELLKFKPYKKDASDDAEWLSHLYGEQKKKRSSECSKGTDKGLEGTSETKKGNDFKLHDLVSFGPKDFGVIIGVESDSFQILKYDEVQGAEVLSLELHEITSSSFDRKFTTMDHRMKATSLSDTVKVLEGPFMGRQGIIKHICRGTIFIYDENQLETGGYFCAKSQSCEKISHSNDTNHESFSDVFGTQGFEDMPASPKSPQSSKKPWQDKENAREFNSRREGDRDGAFSVGQSLRIRVGPLKGHLCRVVAIYRYDVTVKVDSQMKILSVKREHLSEVGAKSNFMKHNDGFGRQGETSGAQTESNGWNSIPSDTGRSSWPDCSSSDFLLDSSWKNPCDSLVTPDDADKDKGDDPWGSKVTPKKTTDSWGHAAGSGGDVEK
ncbi:Transcription elongation factor spt5, partial [Thalictrum thalictroides]